ncbi:MAG: hypothetical protein K2M06_05455 [Muribaculaceae bacterium]|nr:hypothetical protein [Muribaculaceae bacterium]
MTDRSISSPTPASNDKGLRLAAHILSDVFSPMLVPTIGMIVSMTLTGLVVLPASTRAGSTLGVCFITCLLPMLLIFVLIKTGRVSDTSISDPRERTIPFIGTTLCYLGAGLYVYTLHAPIWLMLFFIGAALVTAVCMLITHWWKISAHTSGLGGLTGVVLWLAWRGMFVVDAMIVVSVALVLLGCMASARLILGHHTLGQTAAGALLGMAVEFGLLCYLGTPALNS